MRKFKITNNSSSVATADSLAELLLSGHTVVIVDSSNKKGQKWVLIKSHFC